MGSNPMFPIIIKPYKTYQLYILLNLVKQNNFKSIVLVPTRHAKLFLTLLSTLGLFMIYTYIDNRKKYYKLVFNTVNMNYSYKKIKILSTPQKKYYINYQNLLLLVKRLGKTYLILNTSLGILTHVDALKFKVGGSMLCYILY